MILFSSLKNQTSLHSGMSQASVRLGNCIFYENAKLIAVNSEFSLGNIHLVNPS